MLVNNRKKIDSPVAQLIKVNPEFFAQLKPGDLVEARVIQKDPRAVYFDIDRIGAGIVYGLEFLNAKEAIKNLKIGDMISAKVIEPDNEDGYVEMSLTEVNKQKSWKLIQELMEKGEIIAVKITAANSGGLMTELQEMKAFLPVSQLTPEHYPRVANGDRGKILEELRKLIGQELKVKIIDFNPNNNKLIISERETINQNIKELLAKYKAGDLVDGIISGAADFGAFFRFADNPAIEGLIHISELDHRLIENPKEIVKINDTVKAKIIEIKDGRVFLSLKALKPNPWDKVEEKFKAGQETIGIITRFNPFGAFVGLDKDIHGLIHISEFGSVEEMKKQLEINGSYNFKIEALKPLEKRITLKLVKKEQEIP